jgi:hypothetical protein
MAGASACQLYAGCSDKQCDVAVRYHSHQGGMLAADAASPAAQQHTPYRCCCYCCCQVIIKSSRSCEGCYSICLQTVGQKVQVCEHKRSASQCSAARLAQQLCIKSCNNADKGGK